MKIRLDIDDMLVAKAIEAAGNKSLEETIELGLRRLVSIKAQSEILNLRGKLHWDGDLDDQSDDGPR